MILWEKSKGDNLIENLFRLNIEMEPQGEVWRRQSLTSSLHSHSLCIHLLLQAESLTPLSFLSSKVLQTVYELLEDYLEYQSKQIYCRLQERLVAYIGTCYVMKLYFLLRFCQPVIQFFLFFFTFLLLFYLFVSFGNATERKQVKKRQFRTAIQMEKLSILKVSWSWARNNNPNKRVPHWTYRSWDS